MLVSQSQTRFLISDIYLVMFATELVSICLKTPSPCQSTITDCLQKCTISSRRQRCPPRDLTWDLKTRQWLCQSCIFGVPPKPDPLVCQTNWCLRASGTVKAFRKDSQTWACSGCMYYDLADILDTRPARSSCYDCGLAEVAKGKCKIFFHEDQRQWYCKKCMENQ